MTHEPIDAAGNPTDKAATEPQVEGDALTSGNTPATEARDVSTPTEAPATATAAAHPGSAASAPIAAETPIPAPAAPHQAPAPVAAPVAAEAPAPVIPPAPVAPAQAAPVAQAAPAAPTPAEPVNPAPAAPTHGAPAAPAHGAPTAPTAPAHGAPAAPAHGAPAAPAHGAPAAPVQPGQHAGTDSPTVSYGAQTLESPRVAAPAHAAPAAHGSAPYPAPPLPQHAGGAAYPGVGGSPYDPYTSGGAGTPPTGPDAGNAFSAPSKKPRRGLTLLVSGLVVGALLGGGAGAGVALWLSPQGTPLNSSANAGSGSIAINDTASVNNTAAVAAKTLPSVVTISVSSNSSSGTGSGIVLDKEGHILTNTHVVTLDGAVSSATIQVKDSNGRLHDAKIVGTDPLYDLAVIKVEGVEGLTPMEFADSSELNVGQVAIAVGAPFGLSGSVTDGIVSALNRSITVASSAAPEPASGDQNENGGSTEQPYGFDLPGQNNQQKATGTVSLAVIQTDAAINPGNSGGALVNAKGQLIGVNVAIANGSSSSSGSQPGSAGVGFAIPSNIAKRIAQELITNQKATHGLLGASVTDSTAVSGATVAGAYLKDVSAGGAAAKAGLKAGDIVTAVGESPVGNATDLTAQVRALAAGAQTEITFVRDGKAQKVNVTLGTLS